MGKNNTPTALKGCGVKRREISSTVQVEFIRWQDSVKVTTSVVHLVQVEMYTLRPFE